MSEKVKKIDYFGLFLNIGLLLGFLAFTYGVINFSFGAVSSSKQRIAIEDYYDAQNTLVTNIENRANGSYLVEMGDEYVVVEVNGNQIVEKLSRSSVEGTIIEK